MSDDYRELAKAIVAAIIYAGRFTAPICTPKWAVDEAEKLMAEIDKRSQPGKG